MGDVILALPIFFLFPTLWLIEYITDKVRNRRGK